MDKYIYILTSEWFENMFKEPNWKQTDIKYNFLGKKILQFYTCSGIAIHSVQLVQRTLDYLPKSSRFLAQNQNDKNIPAIKTCSGYDFSFEKLRGNFNVPKRFYIIKMEST